MCTSGWKELPRGERDKAAPWSGMTCWITERYASFQDSNIVDVYSSLCWSSWEKLSKSTHVFGWWMALQGRSVTNPRTHYTLPRQRCKSRFNRSWESLSRVLMGNRLAITLFSVLIKDPQRLQYHEGSSSSWAQEAFYARFECTVW